MGKTSKRAPRKIVLKPEQAASIYALKPSLDSGRECNPIFNTRHRSKGRSVPVGKIFNVSAKTIRDIWNRKTWTFATRHLWVHEEIALIESGQGDYAEHQVCINEKDSSILS